MVQGRPPPLGAASNSVSDYLRGIRQCEACEAGSTPPGSVRSTGGVKDMFFICFEKTYNGGGKRICFLLC